MKLKYTTYPYIVWMIIFIIVPITLVVFFAFTDNLGRFTLENIINVGNYSNVFLNSIFMGILATFICFLLGYPMAYIISRKSQKIKNILMTLFMLPMWMNFLLRTYAWMTLLENNGLINKFLGMFNLGPFNMINTSGAVVLGMVYNFFPYMVLPICTVIEKINHNVIEAAQDLGASKIKVFFKVIFPLSIPGIISGITMVFVISKMLGGGANLMIGDLIDMQFLGSTYNPNLGSAISLVLMLLILICMGIMNQFDDGENEGSIVI